MTDQPVVNVILKNDFKYIDKKWNFLDKFENEEKIGSKFYTLIILSHGR